MMLRVIELFGGIGACTSALKRLGIPHEVVDYVEIDKYACASYNAMNLTNFEPQDICTWDKDIECDLIMHGSPCQDFSVAGQQAGGDEGSGTRSSLMYETIRIVSKLKPKYVIWENVKNLLSKKHRHNFDNYLQQMEQLGYLNFYQVLNAKDYGIPQNRERVFTISILGGGEFMFPEKQELKLRLKDMLEEQVDEKYYLSEPKLLSIANWKAYQKPFEKVQGKNSICPTLTARGAGEEHSGMITYCDELEETTNMQEKILKTTGSSYLRNFGSKGKLQDKDVCDTITASSGTGGGNVPIIKTIGNYSPSGYDASRIVDKDGLAPTVKENHGTVTATNTNDLRIRKLTPKECWRLMGFNDEEFEKAEKVNSNTQLYKQAGNSIVVNVLESIFKNLLGGTNDKC